MDFQNKVVFVTGAGSGIGAETAKSFAKLNAKLALLDINADTLNKTKDCCKENSDNEVLEVVADVSKDEDIIRAVDEIYKKYGKIDVLVNCVGIPTFSGILDNNFLEMFNRGMNVNLRSVAALTHRVAPILVENKGCIVNISSALAKIVTKSTIPYSVSKAGLCQFTKCVALELASKGVRANCVLPGLTKTNILINFGISQEQSDAYFENVAKVLPLNRALNAEEVAELVVFLASDKGKGITGAEFVIDCGESLTSVKETKVLSEAINN